MVDDKDILSIKDAFARADLILKSMEEKYEETFGVLHALNLSFKQQLNEQSEYLDKVYQNSTRFGLAASASAGCKDVGKVIMNVAETHKALFNQQRGFLQTCDNNFLKDSREVVLAKKNALYDNYKNNLSETLKAKQSYEKIAKKEKATKNFEKYYKKLNKKENDIADNKKKAFNSVYDILKFAFLEERKRYCEFVRFQAQNARNLIKLQEENLLTFKTEVNSWEEMSLTSDYLLPEASALVENVCPRERMNEHNKITKAKISSPIIRRNTIQKDVEISNKLDLPKLKVSTSRRSLPDHVLRQGGLQLHVPPSPVTSEYKSSSPNTSPLRNHSSTEFTIIGHYKALFDWIPDVKDGTKLEVVKDEILRAVKTSGNDKWIYGCNEVGSYGWFPSTYAKKITSDEPECDMYGETSPTDNKIQRYFSLNSVNSSSSDSKEI